MKFIRVAILAASIFTLVGKANAFTLITGLSYNNLRQEYKIGPESTRILYAPAVGFNLGASKRISAFFHWSVFAEYTKTQIESPIDRANLNKDRYSKLDYGTEFTYEDLYGPIFVIGVHAKRIPLLSALLNSTQVTLEEKTLITPVVGAGISGLSFLGSVRLLYKFHYHANRTTDLGEVYGYTNLYRVKYKTKNFGKFEIYVDYINGQLSGAAEYVIDERKLGFNLFFDMDGDS